MSEIKHKCAICGSSDFDHQHSAMTGEPPPALQVESHFICAVCAPQIEQLQAQLSAQTEALAQKDDEIARLRDIEGTQAGTIELLKMRAERAETVLAQKDEEIAQRKDAMDNMAWVEKSLQATIHQKDEEIAALRQQLEQRCTELDAAEDVLAQRTAERDSHEVRVIEVERRATLATGHLPCSGCGGPHQFDTSVPSVLWNRVLRKDGREGPEYLCTTCVVKAFAEAGVSFVAELYGDGFSGLPIEVRINGLEAQAAAKIQDENNELRWKFHKQFHKQARLKEQLEQARGYEEEYRATVADLIAKLHAERAALEALTLLVQERRADVNGESEYCWYCQEDINGKYSDGPQPHTVNCWIVRAEKVLDGLAAILARPHGDPP